MNNQVYNCQRVWKQYVCTDNKHTHATDGLRGAHLVAAVVRLINLRRKAIRVHDLFVVLQRRYERFVGIATAITLPAVQLGLVKVDVGNDFFSLSQSVPESYTPFHRGQVVIRRTQEEHFGRVVGLPIFNNSLHYCSCECSFWARRDFYDDEAEKDNAGEW